MSEGNGLGFKLAWIDKHAPLCSFTIRHALSCLVTQTVEPLEKYYLQLH